MQRATIIQQSIQSLFWELFQKSHVVVITSAYIDEQMVQILLQKIGNETLDKLRSIDLILGVDVSTNSEALRLLLISSQKPESILRTKIVGHKPGVLFHPKLYYFDTGDTTHILLGSGNFTSGGLSNNHEIFCHLECPPKSEIARLTKQILERWKSEPFSKPLADDIVELARERSDQFKEFIQHDKGMQKLRSTLNLTQKMIGEALAGTGDSFVNKPTDDTILEVSQPIRYLDKIRNKLSEGYIVTYDVSIARLRVHIPANWLPNALANLSTDSQTLVVGVNRTVYIKLLASDAMKEFEQFRSNVDREIDKFSLIVAGSQYVPPAAHPGFFRAIRGLRTAHQSLLNRYITRLSPIQAHLREHLLANIKEIWIDATADIKTSPPSNVVIDVRKAAEKRRQELRASPLNQLPFHLTTSPHPLVTQALQPEHLAWKLLVVKPEQALFNAFVDLLISQTEAIIGLTLLKQKASLTRQFPRVKMLISMSGKTLNRLLKQLQTLTRSAEQKRSDKNMFISNIDNIGDGAREHLEWLHSLHNKDFDTALDELFREYPL